MHGAAGRGGHGALQDTGKRCRYSAAGPPVFDDAPVQRPEEQGVDAEHGPVLVCRGCGIRIARRAWVVPIDGASAERVFFNPAGVMMEVLTLLRATNLHETGVPTEEFSWFPGYAWRFAHCGGCGRQLGWRFLAVAGAGPGSFWGLLARELVEEDEES